MTGASTTRAAPDSAGTTCQIRVAGHLDDHWAAWLGEFALTRHDDGSTVLVGSVADQAQLHGVLARIRDLGVPLLALSAAGEPHTPPPCPALAHPIRTERLTLRAASAEDADATWAYRRLDAVGEWLTEVPDDVAAYRASFAHPTRLADTVIVERDGALVGDFMLRVEDAWAQAEDAGRARRTRAELGWVLDPAHAGRGYATEAVRALLAYSFDVVGVHRVVAGCFLGNVASWRLMERVGMRREGHAVAESLHRSGRWLDTVTYALLASEWRGSDPRGAADR